MSVTIVTTMGVSVVMTIPLKGVAVGLLTKKSSVVGGPVSHPVTVLSIIMNGAPVLVGADMLSGSKSVSEISPCSLGAASGGDVVAVGDTVIVAFTGWLSPSDR